MIVNFVVAKSQPTDLVSHQAVQQLTCVRYFSFIQALKSPYKNHHPNQRDQPHKSPNQFNALRQDKMFTVYLVGFFNSDIGAH